MASRSLRKVLSLASLFTMGALACSSSAYPHPAVPLKDIDGNPITLNTSKCIKIGNKEYCEGKPVSWEATCGACHKEITGDVTGGVHFPGPVHTAYHIGRGWNELADNFGAERVKEGKDYRKFLRSFGDDGAW
ncbi:hypothetical protein GFV12_01230 [Desulfurobacterium thermolithotrophum]|uniref:hypothetical protein n=1 Tax=Desulfurobacterium thermolithotrophum TaxID=64160 RepID=UPI0013D086B3|nr:hypothetical protein [Desulfurobacterium thermolithotrophum]